MKVSFAEILGILLGLISLAGALITVIFWINAKQDSLIKRDNHLDGLFQEVYTRQLKLRGSLSLVFQKISSRFTDLDARTSNIESFLKNKGFHIREKELRHEDYGEKFWNESGLEDDTKIPE